MNINRNRARQLLNDFDLETLFTQELGWDHHSQTLLIQINEAEYTLTACAEKRGMVAFYYAAPSAHTIPDHAMRRRIERQVARSVREHLIIYADSSNTLQIWQWVKREPGRPEQCRELSYHPTRQEGEALIQSLDAIAFSLDEEEDIGIVDVTNRVRDAFDVERRVTRRFYDHFKKEHDAFLKFVNGIPDGGMQRWYVSVILNRLMFIYFIQKKGFLNNDLYYLRTNLSRSRQTGVDQYYKAFLCPLFFEGFAKPKNERSTEMSSLLGNVPYLNGGIFQKHQMEAHNEESIQIPDDAFERLFTFFEHYQWHLDNRRLRNDNEINPDVLGYIFEKYINQKQMGAYYTKEDITDYISKNTIIPFLLDTARKNCKIAFEPPTDSNSATVWQLLRKQSDRYIYDAVSHGTGHELPPDIAAGINDISERTGWNTLAPPEFGLPTEIWREVVARRQRYETIRAKLSNGDIHEVDDLITYNLDIRQFAQDIIENCEGPDLLRAFWKAIKEVTILDPTCGSGAFLFAALNILEPLYEACLDRMGGFVDELRYAADPPHPNKYSDFRDDLDRIEKHPKPKYFILKSIIINNLYGVDIMEEAIEICKLRLFLKMVAQIEDVNEIEPLPDIDFNIQAGNTLVGYATYEEAEKAITGTFDFDNTMRRIRDSAEDIDALFHQFRLQQLVFRGDVAPAAKQELQDKLHKLKGELNRYLAGEYQVDPNNDEGYQKWLTSHKPFHWFVEFYGILEKDRSDVSKKGGFDVIIGNPPYVESRSVSTYKIRGYDTESCGDLYAYTLERAMYLSIVDGWFGFIVPLSCFSVKGFLPLQQRYLERSDPIFVSNWSGDAHPAKLFEGVDKRLEIVLGNHRKAPKSLTSVHSSKYLKWYSEERPNLFRLYPNYQAIPSLGNLRFSDSSLPKVHSELETTILAKLRNCPHRLTSLTSQIGKYKLYYTRKVSFFLQFLDFVPEVRDNNGKLRPPSELKILTFNDEQSRNVCLGCLSTSLFYWFNIINSDCRNLNKREIELFPVPNGLPTKALQNLTQLLDTLMQSYNDNSSLKTVRYKIKGEVTVQYFNFRPSKPIIDEIDRLLAPYYGFTDEELDFIINYDIKYRMGLGND